MSDRGARRLSFSPMPLYRIRLEALYLFTFPCQDLPSIGQRDSIWFRAEQSIPIAIALDKNSFPNRVGRSGKIIHIFT